MYVCVHTNNSNHDQAIDVILFADIALHYRYNLTGSKIFEHTSGLKVLLIGMKLLRANYSTLL